MYGTLENIITNLISQTLRQELKDFLELEIIPQISTQSKDDPLQLLNTKDVCRLLKVSMPTARKLISTGQLKVYRIGIGKKAPIRIRRSDLDFFISRKHTN